MPKFVITEKIENYLYVAFIITLFSIIFFLAFTSKSLWLDECTAAWVTSGNFNDVLLRSSENLWQSSFYYIFLWSWKNIFGNSEFILRFPSYIAIILSTWFIYLIGKLLKDKTCGLIASMAFLLRDGIVIEAFISARSYALAIFSTILATYFLLIWVNNKKRIYLTFWLFGVVVATYLHYMYAGIIIAHFFLLLATKSFPTKKELICIIIGGLILLSPTYEHIVEIFEGTSIAYTELPNYFRLIWFYSIPLIFFVTIILLLVKILNGKLVKPLCLEKKVFYALVASWLIPPILLFLLVHFLNASFFHLRYFLWTTPFLALTIGFIFSFIYPLMTRFLCVIILFIFGIDCLSNLRNYNENWIDSVKEINNISLNKKTLILSYSGYIESERVSWLINKTHKDYLSAPILYYGAKGEIIPIPGDFSTSWGNSYFEEKIASQINNFQEVLFIARIMDPVLNSSAYKKYKFSYEYHLKYFKEHNLNFKKIGKFGNVILFILDRS